MFIVGWVYLNEGKLLLRVVELFFEEGAFCR